MHRSRWLVIALVCTLAGCSGMSTTPVPTPGATAPAAVATVTVETNNPIIRTAVPAGTPRTPPAAATAPGTRTALTTITQADHTRTITLRQGERVLVQLEDGFLWKFTIEDEQILAPDLASPHSGANQQVFTALRSGKTVLTATGDPLCRQSTPPCLRPSIVFSVTMIVA